MTARDREVGPLISALLFVTLAELMLLGSGRLIQFGPLTLRMYLYLICLVTGLLLVLKRGAVDRDLALLSLAFVGLTAWSAAVGLVNHARMEQVVEDVKPLLFFPIVFFFASTIRTVEQVHRVGTVIRFCSLVLAVAYILALVLIALRIIPFRAVYEVLSQSGEFFFRGHSGAFYKGFLYLGVGFCFFLTGTRRSTILAGLLFLAIALTFTRGMLLATVLTAGIAAALHRRSGVRLPIYLGTLLVSLSLRCPGWRGFLPTAPDRTWCG